MRNERQTRSMATQFRAAGEAGAPRIEGYFAVFGEVYDAGFGWSESIDRHAFEHTLGDDVRALIDHDTRLVLGRTGPGTLRLRVDETGLWGEIDVNPEDQDAMNLYARVKRGDVSQCSFGFEILDEDSTYKENEYKVHFTIKSVKLYEVSVCTFPAYEETGVTARTRESKDIRARSLAAWKERMKGRLRRHGTQADSAGEADRGAAQEA